MECHVFRFVLFWTLWVYCWVSLRSVTFRSQGKVYLGMLPGFQPPPGQGIPINLWFQLFPGRCVSNVDVKPFNPEAYLFKQQQQLMQSCFGSPQKWSGVYRERGSYIYMHKWSLKKSHCQKRWCGYSFKSTVLPFWTQYYQGFTTANTAFNQFIAW